MAETEDAPMPFSHMVQVDDVPPSGLNLPLQPGEAERAALARHVGVLALPQLTARLQVAHEGKDGLRVTGTVTATVRQTCVVSLEPFENALNEAVDVVFAPPGSQPKEVDEDDETYDPPDEIVDGAIDLGALVCEFLALGIDPYPRKPGVVFEPPQEEAGAGSPFAALARLKDRS